MLRVPDWEAVEEAAENFKKIGEAVFAKPQQIVPNTGAAHNAANAERLKKSLVSQSQMAEQGTTIAGGKSGKVFRNAQYIADEYGGNAADWVKKSSSNHSTPNGTLFETHWVENIKTGQRVEFKTKFPNGIGP